MICAARGLPIPGPDEIPTPEALAPRPAIPQTPSSNANSVPGNSSIHKLTLPLGPRSLSTNSEQGGSNPPSPGTGAQRSLKTKGKALATTFISSRNSSQTDLIPREIALSGDNSVNGQTLEVALYKEVQECPICFLDYPPFLNRTRCCDQPICSECFVQIKRPDPHFPEHHGEEVEPRETDTESQLVSEPATCPYCQAPEFGVTYEPPSFRRGLAYASPSIPVGSSLNASSSSLSASSPGPSCQPQPMTRRRAQSLAANAPGVITTDHVRPDWKIKLEALRAHQARRAAAATALHTATYLMGNNSEGTRSLFRSARLNRRQVANQSSNLSAASDLSASITPAASSQPGVSSSETNSRGGMDIQSGFYNSRQVEDLEELMLAEAMRLSLADEEQRRRNVEKALKEAKEKDTKEKEKGESGAGQVLSTLTCKRGESATSGNLRIEASLANAMGADTHTSPNMPDKGKSIERREDADKDENDSSESSPSGTISSLPISAIGNYGHKPSHLRQMSNASSATSSLVDSVTGSYTVIGANPRASGLSVNDEDGQREGSTPNESMFNFRSLAEMVGVNLEDSGDQDEGSNKQAESGQSHEQGHIEKRRSVSENSPTGTAEQNDNSTQLKKDAHKNDPSTVPPELMVTPNTPATERPNKDSKGLANESGVVNRHAEITQ